MEKESSRNITEQGGAKSYDHISNYKKPLNILKLLTKSIMT